MGGFIDPKLSWKDIEWLRKHTKLPIGLKGVQSVEDAKKAAAMGIEAIYLSNHGCVAAHHARRSSMNPDGTTLVSIADEAVVVRSTRRHRPCTH